jgi:hypothetical protein
MFIKTGYKFYFQFDRYIYNCIREMPTGKHRYSGIYYREASRKKSTIVVVLYVKKK